MYFCLWLWYFNPLPPHGGRLAESIYFDRRKTFQSTPSAWRETFSGIVLISRPNISIHSLRMEGDRGGLMTMAIDFNFNPLPPHGGRPASIICGNAEVRFQSTPSAWRETTWKERVKIHSIYFNPLPPHGGRLTENVCCVCSREFQSTPSAWRETQKDVNNYVFRFISIHSLRMEGDHRLRASELLAKAFQSTPSAWRETHCVLFWNADRKISIHSLRMEGDESLEN